ncbi:hypothetical protein D187_001088 [Cystobacter fuscus DSM 2262]|uniref:Uncharacterized protein n=1 Tax=Cystobacter fuscus (strain ATCC 25194 / DSM 2262 / NBRC 100088 / M29) TaxID=1242864 RepID=S9PA68_CYSF2|nr:hypothetical protein D187_001088 [Cystobacter fuscus DSM 2262]
MRGSRQGHGRGRHEAGEDGHGRITAAPCPVGFCTHSRRPLARGA